MVYEGGHVQTIKSVDVDYISFFTLLDYFLDVGCVRGGRLWFKINGLPTNDGVEEILNDVDINNMVSYNSGCDSLDIFMVEHDSLVVVLPAKLNEKDRQSMGVCDEVAGMQGQQNTTNVVEGGDTGNMEKKTSKKIMQQNIRTNIIILNVTSMVAVIQMKYHANCVSSDDDISGDSGYIMLAGYLMMLKEM